MNYRVSLFLLLLFFFIPNVKAESNHFSMTQSGKTYYEEPNALTLFYLPIKFTRSGIRCFLKHVFNRPEYATEFLPYNFTHVLQFLEYGKKTEQTAVYMQSIIRLFYNKIKATHFITSYALHEFLEPLPNFIQDHCAPQEISTIFTQIKISVKDLLYKTFLKRFSFFKKNPDEFFDELSEDILEEIQGNFYETPLRQEQFRQSIIRFLEIALNKIIWYPSDGQDTWKSVKLFAHQIYQLHQTDIIDEDELDDFYKSLLERFCYYLDMHGSGISLKTLAIIRNDITSKKLHFLELEEQEAYLEPKPKRLKRALIIAEAKIHAHAQGIVT